MEKFIPPIYQLTCPNCQQPFTANHLNRRYCSKECKVWANNHKARAERLPMQEVNNILSKNRQILRGYRNGAIVSNLELLEKGFNFAYQTYETVYENVKYICCYEAAYQFTDSKKDKVKIIFFKFK